MNVVGVADYFLEQQAPGGEPELVRGCRTEVSGTAAAPAYSMSSYPLPAFADGRPFGLDDDQVFWIFATCGHGMQGTRQSIGDLAKQAALLPRGSIGAGKRDGHSPEREQRHAEHDKRTGDVPVRHDAVENEDGRRGNDPTREQCDAEPPGDR